MRVVALTHVFPRGPNDPSAPFLLTWARALRTAGAQVSVVAPHDAGLPAGHTVDGVPVRLARYAPDRFERMAYRGEMHQLVRSPAGPPLVGSLVRSLAAALRSEVRERRPDVVHVHWWVPGAVALRFSRVRVPTVCTVHGTDVALIESRPSAARLARWALRGADRVEAVSADLAERLERATGIVADAVNPMPLEPHWLADSTAAAPHEVEGADSAPARLLAVGRMVPEKGFADLIAAAATITAPVTVEIIGDGPQRDELTALAAELGVALELPGRCPPDALRAAYRRADVVVQASHREGLGLVAAEALLCGTPVVATDSGGVRDVMPGDELVAPGDATALAERIAAVLADPQGPRARARDHAERLRSMLSPEAAAARTLEGYATL